VVDSREQAIQRSKINNERDLGGPMQETYLKVKRIIETANDGPIWASHSKAKINKSDPFGKVI